MDISKLSGVMQQAQQRFQKADANADGAISRAEFDQARANAPDGAPSIDFNSFDGDGDGMLTEDEIQAGVQTQVKSAMKAALQNGPRGAAFAGGGAAQTDVLGSLLATPESEDPEETDPNAQYAEKIQDALNEEPRVTWLSHQGLVNKVV